MHAPRLAFVVVLSAVAAAQQPELEVQDLLLSEAVGARSGAPDFVSRGLLWLRESEANRPRHRVSGEGHLMPRWQAFSEPPEQRGAFTEDSLVAALALLRGPGSAPARLERIGNTVLLQSDYPEQMAAALEVIRRRLPPRIDVDIRLERISADATTTILSGTETFSNGEVRLLADVERRPVLYDFDVEIAQASATANPIIGEVDAGASIAVRARPLPFHDEAVVEVVMRATTRLPVEPFSAHPSIGPFDVVSSRVDEGGLTFRVARNQAVSHEWTTLEGARLRLTCTARWDAPEAAGDDEQLVCSPLFGAPALGFRSTTAGEPEKVVDAIWGEHLVERARSGAADGAIALFEPGDANGGGVLLLKGGAGARVARVLGASFAVAFEPAHITVEAIEVAEGVDVPAEGPLPIGARLVARLSGPVTVGLPACFASAHERTFIRDWDVEVAQSARIPDPKVDMVEEGWFATVCARRGPDGRVDRLDLVLHVETLADVRVASVSINAEVIALGSVTDDRRAPTVCLPQDVLSIELPVVRSLRVGSTLRLDQAGVAILRRSATTCFGPGRVLVVRVRVGAGR